MPDSNTIEAAQQGKISHPSLVIDVKERDKFIADYVNKPLLNNILSHVRLRQEFTDATKECIENKKEEDGDTRTKLLTMHSELNALGIVCESQQKAAKRVEDEETKKLLGIRDEMAGQSEVNTQAIEAAVKRHLNGEPISMWSRIGDGISNKVESFEKKDTAQTLAQRLRSGGTGEVASIPMEVEDIKAAVMKTTAGWSPFTPRDPGYVSLIAMDRPLETLDMIPFSRTANNAIIYNREKTVTENVDYVAEGALFQESGLVMEQVTVNVVKFGTFLPVTFEQLEDEGQAEAYINDRLPMLLRRKLNSELLNGATGSGKLGGIVNQTGVGVYKLPKNSSSFQTEGKELYSSLYKAQSKSWQDSWFMPTSYMLAEQAWSELVTTLTTAGGFILGSPQNNFDQRLWGLRVVRTIDFTFPNVKQKDVGVVGSWDMASDLAVRRDLMLEVGQPGDYMLRQQYAYLVSMRAALKVIRPQSFVVIRTAD